MGRTGCGSVLTDDGRSAKAVRKELVRRGADEAGVKEARKEIDERVSEFQLGWTGARYEDGARGVTLLVFAGGK